MEDACGFNGDGSSTWAGMRGICPTLIDGAHAAGAVTAGSGHSTFSTLDAADLASLMGALPDKFWPACKFYCSGYAAAQTFARLGATTGRTRLGRPLMSLAGMPIVITPESPSARSQTGKVMTLFGDLSGAAAIGSRSDLILATSTDRYFDSDQVAYRVTERVGLACHNLGDSGAAGASVGLAGR
jgi:HK97 family phage major capsid protein